MALIRRADAQQMARDAVALDLREVRIEADRMVAAAKAEAERIRADAEAEAERIKAEALETGTREGRKIGRGEGEQAGREAAEGQLLESLGPRIEALAAGWENALSEFEQAREGLVADARQDLVRLAVTLAGRVVNRTIESDDELVARLAEEAMGRVLTGSRVEIRVCPDDEETLDKWLAQARTRTNASAAALVVPDRSLEPGSCVITTAGGGRIDASVRTKLERIAARLLGDQAAEDDTGSDTPESDTPEAGKPGMDEAA